MNVFDLLRFFLPLRNPLGFGIVDYLELALAALLVGAFIVRSHASRALIRIAERPRAAMIALFTAPILLRLSMLPKNGVPIPQVADDFSFLLLGDTLTHLRFANPTHPMYRFFESVFVLQQPSYASIYPMAQGFVLAIGQILFHSPWAGVLLSIGLMCAMVYWMLRAWVEPVWALIGGVLAIIHFGPFNQWTNTYWGGAVPAIAGCMVFGTIPRLWRLPVRRDAAILGAGLGLHALARPFETVFLAICVLVAVRRDLLRFAPAVFLAASPALLLTLVQNKAVTGDWTTLPYMLSRDQYGVPTSFTFQAVPVPHRPLTFEQAVDYEAQKEVHGEEPDSLRRYLSQFADRFRYLRYFFYPPLWLAVPFVFVSWRDRRVWWAIGSVALFALGSGAYPYFYPHYIAATTCLFVLVAVLGLRALWRVRLRGYTSGHTAATLIVLLVLFQFGFWYVLHLAGNDQIFAVSGKYESWDYVNFGDREGRLAIARTLAQAPGEHLVFVRFGSRHILREWIQNGADIDSQRVVWALDLGPEKNQDLRRYYPKRRAWICEPDAEPPRVTPVE
jgi:hypothetical protein